MNSFTEAFDYIKTTSAEDIARRTAIYGAWFNMCRYKDMGHDIILDIIAAICGPFDMAKVTDGKILELLNATEFGFHPNWPNMMIPWINKYATSKREAEAFVNMVNFLFTNSKTDEILREYNYICQEIRPSKDNYFPEMNFSNVFKHNLNVWERI